MNLNQAFIQLNYKEDLMQFVKIIINVFFDSSVTILRENWIVNLGIYLINYRNSVLTTC